jgi:hypothetical protein
MQFVIYNYFFLFAPRLKTLTKIYVYSLAMQLELSLGLIKLNCNNILNRIWIQLNSIQKLD